jgi:8-oxo-dGTP diphosphatase
VCGLAGRRHPLVQACGEQGTARRRVTAVHGDGNGWVVCAEGHRHWGRHGAAGLLLRRRVEDRVEVLMQHRAPWTASGDTWGLPGGARDSHESARETALREAGEEAGVTAAAVRVLDELQDDHGGWHYVTVVAEAVERITVVANEESLDLRWVAEADVDLLDLHPGFARTWPLLREVRRG